MPVSVGIGQMETGFIRMNSWRPELSGATDFFSKILECMWAGVSGIWVAALMPIFLVLIIFLQDEYTFFLMLFYCKYYF